MRLGSIGAVWAAGAVLALALFLSGPFGLAEHLDRLAVTVGAALDDLIPLLHGPVFDALRAAVTALYAVFVMLAILSARRGLRGRAAIVGVTLLMIPLAWSGPASPPRWLLAFALVAAGAASMTLRLMRRQPAGPR